MLQYSDMGTFLASLINTSFTNILHYKTEEQVDKVYGADYAHVRFAGVHLHTNPYTKSTTSQSIPHELLRILS